MLDLSSGVIENKDAGKATGVAYVGFQSLFFFQAFSKVSALSER